MATQVVMPKLSPTMEEGQLARWLKKEGDSVAVGEPLAEIDTDKATMEMQALGSGVLRKILIREGETAPLGQLIGIIGSPDEDISALLKEAGSGAGTGERGTDAATKEPAGKKESASGDVPAGEQTRAERVQSSASPFSAHVQSRAQASAVGALGGGDGRLIVSPLAARMAAEAGVNLRSLRGTGPGGRIIKRDIEAALSSGAARTAEAAEPTPERAVYEPRVETRTEAPGAPSTYHDEPASELRRTIARRLVTSLGPVPHFFLTVDVEMDKAAEMRRRINELEPQQKISLNDMIIKVAAVALIRHPRVNASFQDRAVRYYDRADIGVAVAIEDGLITPVVRSADLKSIGEIAREVREMAERARSRKLRPEEYTGATFSISNLGMFGIDEFTAVINPPEAAILAIGAMSPKPVVRDGQLTVRQMMRVTMSCDHRIVDGATGADFLKTFKRIMEDPLYLLI